MSRRVALLDMLGHPIAQSAVQQIAQGIDPRLVAAQLAGNALTDRIARSLGAVAPKPQAPVGDIIDAEYTVINVSPGVKRRAKAGVR